MEFRKGLKVIHVTKEFGPASFGGIGTMVSGLAVKQAEYGMKVSVVMPFYKFLRKGYSSYFDHGEVTKFADIQIEVQTPFHGSSLIQVLFQIIVYPFVGSTKTMVHVPVYVAYFKGVRVLLVGPSSDYPFNLCFSGDSPSKIYDVEYGISHEWQYLYFASSVAKLFDLLNADDVVFNIHGATNGMALLFNTLNCKIVYVMHDYSFEPAFSLPLRDVSVFYVDDHKNLRRFLAGNRLFFSILAVHKSSSTVFVSKYLSNEIISGRLKDPLLDVVLPYLMEKVSNRRFYGISNGLSLDRFNPFDDIILRQYGLELTASMSNQEIRNKKIQAKLILQDRILGLSACKHIGLFIGRISFDKGADLLFKAANELKNESCIIVMGQISDIPKETVDNALQLKNVFIIRDSQFQDSLGMLVRLGSDFGIVTSRTESFGLVALESYLFGNPIVSTNVGGLKEFSNLYSNNNHEWNTVLIREHTVSSIVESCNLINVLLPDYNHSRLIQHALSYTWDGSYKNGFEKSKLSKYSRVYEESLNC